MACCPFRKLEGPRRRFGLLLELLVAFASMFAAEGMPVFVGLLLIDLES